MREATRVWGIAGAVAAMTLVAADACSTNDPGGAPDAGAEAGTPDVRPPDAAAPCEGTPQSDPNNCGACGHSCLGGDCVAGQCQPLAIWNGQSPSAVAIDANNLYWAEAASWQFPTGVIWKLPLAGGAPVQLATQQRNPSALALDATNVYWTNNAAPGGSVSTVPIAGGAVTQLVKDADCVTLALTDTEIVWDQFFYPPGTSALLRMAKDGGTATAIAPRGDGIVTDGTNLYWTDFLAGGVFRTALTGDAGVVELVGGQVPERLALRAGALYWGSWGFNAPDSSTLMTMPADGGTPVTLASGLDHSAIVTTDDTDVYFCDVGTHAEDGAVLRVSHAGGPVTVLARNQGDPVSIVVDATAVYWANKLDGTVMRLAK